jgi:hypothetical protein
MLKLKNSRGGTSPWIPFVILLVVFGLFVALAYLPTRNRVNKIHQYLGTNHGTDPANWSGLVGSIEMANKFHREQYTQIACEFWKLKNPAHAEPEPVPCPPPPGGPTSKPPSPPTYP